jgi:hypothetical protein
LIVSSSDTFIYLPCFGSRPAVQPTLSPVHLVPQVKLPEREPDHPPLYNVEVNNEMSHASPYAAMSCLGKLSHKDMLTR